MILILLGAPGTGKGTQGNLLATHYNIPKISTGEILREAIEKKTELGNKAKKYMDLGNLVPDDVIIGIVKERVKEKDCLNGCIFDGFPRTVKQAEALDEYFEIVGLKLDYVLEFKLSRNKIIERLTGRLVCRNCGKDYNIISKAPATDKKCDDCGGEVVQRSDDTEATVKNRLLVYEEKTKPLEKYYRSKGKLATFDAEGTIQEIQDKIIQFLS
ncbi:adenylate kinase [candidate division KSB1 bacterium 4572_119]|nr:MAG: adenylate kinase [candidate division KSB1 bacterium 4572_119]